MPAITSTSDDRANSRFKHLTLLCELHIDKFQERGIGGFRTNRAVWKQAIDSHFQGVRI